MEKRKKLESRRNNERLCERGGRVGKKFEKEKKAISRKRKEKGGRD